MRWWILLILLAVPAHAEKADYRALYQRGALRGGAPLARYRDQLMVLNQDQRKRTRTEIRPIAPIYQSILAIGRRMTLPYGKDGAQIDFKARVVDLDPKQGQVKVLGLERTKQGIRRTERWVSVDAVQTANLRETWPDGTRVLSGGPSDDVMSVMVVDRRNDPELSRFLLREVKPLAARFTADPRGLVDAVATLVAGKIRYNMDTDADVGGREVLLGDYLRSGVGVCRNYAAITKVALDELGVAGLEVRYVSGQARDRHAFQRGRHAWLEVTLPNGQRYGVDPTWKTPVTPIGRFYADHKHVPTYHLRALHLPDDPAPAVPPNPEPALHAGSQDRSAGFRPSAFVAPGRAVPTTGWRLPAGGLSKGRQLVYRFEKDELAFDATAEILEVDARAARVKIRASQRGVNLERTASGKLDETAATRRVDRWVPLDGVRAALEVVDRGAFSVDGLIVDRARDPRLDDFLKTEIAPIAASPAQVQTKIARALGRVRMRLGQKEVDGNAPLPPGARLGDLLAGKKVAAKPFAAAALTALLALEIPGLELRYVAGTRFDRDLMVHGPGAWLEAEYVEKGQRIRLGIDANSGRVDPIEQFYGLHRYAPHYEDVRLAAVPR